MCNLVAHVNVGWVIMYMTVCLSKWTVLYHMYMSHVQCITCVFELMNVLYHMYMFTCYNVVAFLTQLFTIPPNATLQFEMEIVKIA